MAEAETVAFERILAFPSGAHEPRDRLVLVDRLAELVVEREVLTDPVALAVRRQPPAARPGERIRPGQPSNRALDLPHLHGDDVLLGQDARAELRVLLPRHLDLVVADEQRTLHTVDVADERRLLGIERLR